MYIVRPDWLFSLEPQSTAGISSPLKPDAINLRLYTLAVYLSEL